MSETLSSESGRPPVATDPAVLKVLDIGNMVAGPFAATLLGDLGAEVVKVEKPATGDFIRSMRDEEGLSLLWQVHGRNKRSVTLDFSKPAGRAIFIRLVQWADILVENFRPGVMKRLGLDYDTLHGVNPRLVYLSVSGYGQSGPYSERPSYEWAGAAFGGLTFLTGFPDRPPVMPGIAVTDHTGALFGVVGALEAIRRRDAAGARGTGTHVDSSLYEPVIRMSNAWLSTYSYTGAVQQREGSFPSGQLNPHSKLGYAYETSDGRYIANFPATRAQFERLCRAIGKPEFVDDPRFATDSDRMRTNFNVLDAAVREWVARQTFDEAVKTLVEADQPLAPVNGPAEIFADEHVAARQNLVELPTPTGRTVHVPGIVPHIKDNPGSIRWPAEALGASNSAVYGQLLGISDEDLAGLHEDGVV